MESEQFCRRTAARDAEAVRRELLEKGVIDTSLRPAHDGGEVLFPVLCETEATEKYSFECRKEAPPLPRHEQVGGIAIIQEEDPGAAALLLSSRPSLHTVLFGEGPVEGVFRTRRFRVLAGEDTTRTEVTEYGCRFLVDLAEAYFSARLAQERQRVLACMDEGERVLDMFAGVGPFAIMLAAKARVVWASDLNPAAVLLMGENILKNRRTNVVPILADAKTLPRIFQAGFFDRIIMNLPMDPSPFLEGAFSLCREGGHIHVYSLQEEDGALIPLLREHTSGRIEEHMVRSYSPAQHHAVYDVEFLPL